MSNVIVQTEVLRTMRHYHRTRSEIVMPATARGYLPRAESDVIRHIGLGIPYFGKVILVNHWGRMVSNLRGWGFQGPSQELDGSRYQSVLISDWNLTHGLSSA